MEGLSGLSLCRGTLLSRLVDFPPCVCVCVRVAAGTVPQAGFKPSFPRLPNEELWERGNRGCGVKGRDVGA